MLSAKVSNFIAPAGHTIPFTNPDKYLDYYNTALFLVKILCNLFDIK
jgi:hypothetical protein